jgi:ribokinase
MARKSLADFDVDIEHLFAAQAKNTGVVVTLVNAIGENAVCTYTGANSALGSQDIQAAEQVISEADVCLIHGALPQEAIVTAVRCAQVHGVKVILNPARPMEPVPSASLADEDKSGDRPKMERSSELPAEYFLADILIPNLYEAADITDQEAANIHTAKLIGSDLVARGVRAAVITMGRRGCMVVDRNGADHIPAFEVELVDQTGRGDAFAGALAAYYSVKDDVREAVRFASAAGALACTKFGSIEALPTKEEIIQLLQRED